MLDVEWLYVPDLEKLTQIPERTLRRYLTNHAHHLRIKKTHRNYQVASDSVPVLIQIRDLYSSGCSTDQIEDALARSGIPRTITIKDSAGEKELNLVDTINHLRKAMAEVMAEMAEGQEQLLNEVKELRSELAVVSEQLTRKEEEGREAQEERDRLILERDQFVIDKVKELINEKSDLMKKSFWQRFKNIFGG